MPLSTDDIVAIQQLCARYNHSVDAGDGVRFAATFTEDGVLNSGAKVQGRAALEEFARRVPGQVPSIRHVAVNIMIDGEGDAATVSAYLLVLGRSEGEGPLSVRLSGRYNDHLVKKSGAWLFTERTFTAD